MLYQELDPASVIAEMSDMLNQALVDPHVAAAMLENFHLFENGIVWGLMSAIRNIITGSKSTQSTASPKNVFSGKMNTRLRVVFTRKIKN